MGKFLLKGTHIGWTCNGQNYVVLAAFNLSLLSIEKTYKCVPPADIKLPLRYTICIITIYALFDSGIYERKCVHVTRYAKIQNNGVY